MEAEIKTGLLMNSMLPNLRAGSSALFPDSCVLFVSFVVK